jgi:hypothetical protein
MSTNQSYQITPANNHCSNQQNVVVQSQSNSQNQIDAITKQQQADSQYDTMTSIPQTGGMRSNQCVIFFKNKKFIYTNKLKKRWNEDQLIREFLNNKIYKQDDILEIIYTNKKSIYIIRGHVENLFEKIYTIYKK